MSTKLDPGKFDCYAKLADDEPYFVLRAKDPHAPALVELWAALRTAEFGDCTKFQEARICARDMRVWFVTTGQNTPQKRHLAYVQRFLTEMYQIMVDPCEEFDGNVEQLCNLLKQRALEDREKIHEKTS